MDHFDPNMIEDAIIRKRATQFIGGGAPKTYTRLYLYPAGSEVMKSRNVFNLLNAYGYFMPIPVSPSNLEYKRGASHNEAYGIVSGGLLQRNLPKLWHLTIDTYLPRDIYERTFHNWSQDREWSGEYTQQHFVDYINLIMQYKIPLALFDSSSPERIRHNAEYWCIEQFNYKMQPHDDIDYTLDLIEWKEPHVNLSEIEMKEVTQTPTGPSVRRGDGTALMVFGDNDSRVYNKGEVYDPRVKIAFTMREGTRVIGYTKLQELQQAVRGIIDGKEYQVLDGGHAWSADIRYDNATWLDANTVRIPYHTSYPKTTVVQTVTRSAAMTAIKSQAERMLSAALGRTGTKLDASVGMLSHGGISATGGRSNDLVNMGLDILNSHEGDATRTHLHINAWCIHRETRYNVPLYTLKFSPKKERETTDAQLKDEYGYMELKITKLRTWFKEMYVVSPTPGTKLQSLTPSQTGTTPKGDLYYDSKQSWLVPKENTIRTSYKKYLATVLINYNEGIPTVKEASGAVQVGNTEDSGVIPNKENNLLTREDIIKALDDGTYAVETPWKNAEQLPSIHKPERIFPFYNGGLEAWAGL